MSDQTKGLYNKYLIINRETGQEAEGDYFVLRPEKDAAARPALLRYAEETACRNEKLAADLWKWIQSIDAYADCPEDEYPLLDGTTVILSPGDRVLFQRSSPNTFPLTIDADSIMDDVLQAYKATLLQLGQVSRERDAAQQTISRQQEVISRAHKCVDRGHENYCVELAEKVLRSALGEGAKEETLFSFPNCPICNGNKTIAHPSKAGIWLCVPCDKVFEDGAQP